MASSTSSEDSSAMTTSNAFRFLDLPAEMRNRVYEEVLYHDRPSGHMGNVNILRTCHQVLDEAKDLLYVNSSFTISVTTQTEYIAIDGDLEHSFCQPYNYGRASIAPVPIYNILPPSLPEVRRINVHLKVALASTAFNFLYAFGCRLNNSATRPKELHIDYLDCDPEHVVWEDNWKEKQDMWYGLAKMPSDAAIFVIGDLPSNEIKTDMRHRLLKSDHIHPELPTWATFNTITEFLQLKAEINSMRVQPSVLYNPRFPKQRTKQPGVEHLNYMKRRLHRVSELLDRGYAPFNYGRTTGIWWDSGIMDDLNMVNRWLKMVKNGTWSQNREDVQSFLEERHSAKKNGAEELRKWASVAEKEISELASNL